MITQRLKVEKDGSGNPTGNIIRDDGSQFIGWGHNYGDIVEDVWVDHLLSNNKTYTVNQIDWVYAFPLGTAFVYKVTVHTNEIIPAGTFAIGPTTGDQIILSNVDPLYDGLNVTKNGYNQITAVSSKHTGIIEYTSNTISFYQGFSTDQGSGGSHSVTNGVVGLPSIEYDFAVLKANGSNIIRICLQLDKFMSDLNTVRTDQLNNLKNFLDLAAKYDIYVVVNGANTWVSANQPDFLTWASQEERWSAMATFWQAVATKVKSHPAVAWYSLINEPVDNNVTQYTASYASSTSTLTFTYTDAPSFTNPSAQNFGYAVLSRLNGSTWETEYIKFNNASVNTSTKTVTLFGLTRQWKGNGRITMGSETTSNIYLCPINMGTVNGQNKNWLTADLFNLDRYYEPYLTLIPRDQTKEQVAANWMSTMRTAIRNVDPNTPITAGIAIFFGRAEDANSGFRPSIIQSYLDLLSPHQYQNSTDIFSVPIPSLTTYTVTSALESMPSVGFVRYTALGHNFIVGEQVVIAGSSIAGYNGTFTITAVATNTFDVVNTTTGSETWTFGSVTRSEKTLGVNVLADCIKTYASYGKPVFLEEGGVPLEFITVTETRPTIDYLYRIKRYVCGVLNNSVNFDYSSNYSKLGTSLWWGNDDNRNQFIFDTTKKFMKDSIADDNNKSLILTNANYPVVTGTRRLIPINDETPIISKISSTTANTGLAAGTYSYLITAKLSDGSETMVGPSQSITTATISNVSLEWSPYQNPETIGGSNTLPTASSYVIYRYGTRTTSPTGTKWWKIGSITATSAQTTRNCAFTDTNYGLQSTSLSTSFTDFSAFENDTQLSGVVPIDRMGTSLSGSYLSESQLTFTGNTLPTKSMTWLNVNKPQTSKIVFNLNSLKVGATQSVVFVKSIANVRSNFENFTNYFQLTNYVHGGWTVTGSSYNYVTLVNQDGPNSNSYYYYNLPNESYYISSNTVPTTRGTYKLSGFFANQTSFLVTANNSAPLPTVGDVISGPGIPFGTTITSSSVYGLYYNLGISQPTTSFQQGVDLTITSPNMLLYGGFNLDPYPLAFGTNVGNGRALSAVNVHVYLRVNNPQMPKISLIDGSDNTTLASLSDYRGKYVSGVSYGKGDMVYNQSTQAVYVSTKSNNQHTPTYAAAWDKLYDALGTTNFAWVQFTIDKTTVPDINNRDPLNFGLKIENTTTGTTYIVRAYIEQVLGGIQSIGGTGQLMQIKLFKREDVAANVDQSGASILIDASITATGADEWVSSVGDGQLNIGQLSALDNLQMHFTPNTSTIYTQSGEMQNLSINTGYVEVKMNEILVRKGTPVATIV